MHRDRSALGQPMGVDGPWLAAILTALDDIHATLGQIYNRLPGGQAVEPNDLASFGREQTSTPRKVQEPAPDDAPTIDEALNTPAVTRDIEPGDPGTSTEGVTDAEADSVERPAPPARAGRGSSAEAWRTWATNAGVTVPDDASRDDIIAACERAGVLDGGK